MKQMEYRGEPTSFARLGDLKKGDRINVTIGDWDWLKKDRRFKTLTPEWSAGEIEAAARIKPWAHQFFDLRTIPWEHPNVYGQLLARATKPKLLLILQGIEAIGGVLPEKYDRNSDREVLCDAVVEASRLMQWDKLSKEERLSLPPFSELEATPEEPVKASEPAAPVVVATRTRTRAKVAVS